jgi:hypothetical protein
VARHRRTEGLEWLGSYAARPVGRKLAAADSTWKEEDAGA